MVSFFQMQEENGLMAAIRGLVNYRDNLVRQSTRCRNRLHALIRGMYPFCKKMFKNPFLQIRHRFLGKIPISYNGSYKG